MKHTAFTFERLLDILAPDSPEQVQVLRDTHRKVEHGLLSVGIKLHILEMMEGMEWLVRELDSEHYAGNVRPYRHADGVRCLVLPPIGSANAAILLLRCLEVSAQEAIFNTPFVQIQVCSPNRLEPRNAAILSMAFYLGSNIIRPYDLADLTTTFSCNRADNLWRGKRIAIFDGRGMLDRDFDFWDREGDYRIVNSWLPFAHERTDILTCNTPTDVRNVNLAATLLTHAELDAWWNRVGGQFIGDFEDLLERHDLKALLQAPWIVHEQDEHTREDGVFFLALQELMSYALSEVERLNKPRNPLDYPGMKVPKGILSEVYMMLRRYRLSIEKGVTGENP